MNEYSESLRPLAEIIEALLGCTQGLVDRLGEEREALIARDVDRLSCVVRAKSDSVHALSSMEERLVRLCGPGGIPPSFEKRLAQIPQGGLALASRWLELGRLARRASDANLENGNLIEARERQVRGALAAMQPQGPSTYGRSGYGRTSFGGRVHGCA